jgi:uncharacterized protein (TIGR03437 family)
LVTGSNFTSDSQVYFDGLPASTTIVDAAHATAVPPPGAGRQNAVVTVYSADGQNSMFLAPDPPPTFSSSGSGGDSASPTVTVSPSVLPAGVRALVDISGTNTAFADGFMSVGFGSSDVTVRRVWVLSPTHLWVNVQVAPNAQPGSSYVTVSSGFQTASQPNAFQISAANSSLPVVEPTLINAVWLPSGVFPGAIASLFGVNLGGSQTSITINNQPVTIAYASPTQINLVIPTSLQPGPAILRLNNGTSRAYAVAVSIDPAPPSITAVEDTSNTNISATNPAHPGDELNVLVSGLASPGATVTPSRVHVTVAGLDVRASSATAVKDSTYLVQFKLDSGVTTGAQVPLTVSIDGKTSLPAYIAINP